MKKKHVTKMRFEIVTQLAQIVVYLLICFGTIDWYGFRCPGWKYGYSTNVQ